MLLLLFSSLLQLTAAEPQDVIIQYLYKPRVCKDIGNRGDTMHVQYLGRFYESKIKFDSSYDRKNVPFNYQLGIGGVIEGYQIGTKNMCINERRRLIVPSKYAYGESGTSGIPGYSTLMFDVHLVQINDQAPSYPTPDPEEEKLIVETHDENTTCEQPIKKGDIIALDYTGTLPDDSVFDNGTGIKFVVGSAQVIAGIDEGVLGLCLSASATIHIPPTKGWGDKWDGPVPQWSHVYYNVTVREHEVMREEDVEEELTFETVSRPAECFYTVTEGDYILLKYTVYSKDKEVLGAGQIRYPVGRRVLVEGWDIVLEGACVGEKRSCYIPGHLAHKIGTSLFLAPPQTAFSCELEVLKILLSHEEKDEIDLMAEYKDGLKETQKVLISLNTHSEL